jgi:CRISPR-associated protein Cmr6
MQKGVLKVKIKASGHRKKAEIIADKKLTIPKEFILDNELNDKECDFELNEKNQIAKIIVEGNGLEKRVVNRVKKIKRCENKNNIRVPNDTCLLISDFGIRNIENFNLRVNKFTMFNEDNEPKIKEQKLPENFFNKNWNFYHSKIRNYYKNIQKLNLNFSEPIDLTIHYRLLIGAEQSIYETSIRLHHIYGIPYIPSTAIKGVVRSYTIQKKYKNSEERALDSEEFKKWFGSQKQEGKIVFFDTFPISEPKIKMDIINPMEETKIINFLTVEDTEFQFLIGFKDEVYDGFITLFKEALTEHGIGAKTAVGYGYFQ